MASPTAHLAEIFSGIQGEGVFVGVRHLFVRFCGCNRHCRYCDTREAIEPTPTCSVEDAAGSRRFTEEPNPFAPERAAEAILRLSDPPRLHDYASLTGGEPLLHPDFIIGLAPRIAEHGLPIYLETNGTLPDALERVVACVRHISMDIKLESATGEPTPWAEHRRFIEVAALTALQVKIVVTAQTTCDELVGAADLLKGRTLPAPLVLQPVTPVGGAEPPEPGCLLRWQARLLRRHPDVRVIPQVHRLMGQK